MTGVLIIGGGIIGLNCAYQLQKKGIDVQLMDEFNFNDNCSIGNMGYISPSHFTPLTSPDIVWKAFKWMTDSSSPLYIKPRFDLELIRWGLAFLGAANKHTLERNSEILFRLLMDSREMMQDIHSEFGYDLNYTERGCLMLCQSESSLQHETETARKAEQLGMNAEILSAQQVQDLETRVDTTCCGAVWFKQDAHLDSAAWINALISYLKLNGVKFIPNQKVVNFEIQNNKITKVYTESEGIDVNSVVIAIGSKMPELLKKIGERNCKIQAGKGYSFDYKQLETNLLHPSILVDHRAATTPFRDRLRLGGTMEISGHQSGIRMNRVRAIYEAFSLYYPTMNLDFPQPDEIWSGFRPVSFDGMPYISSCPKIKNAFIAGGHSMLGVSLAAITGKIIADLVDGTNDRDLTGLQLNR